MATVTDPVVKQKLIIEKAVVRFAGDSGDGMQISGNQFTNTVALHGNDLATFPDFPAEIRAPAGTLPGVSGYQIQFSSSDIYTPGDSVDVLVAMNPAALRMNRAIYLPSRADQVPCVAPASTIIEISMRGFAWRSRM